MGKPKIELYESNRMKAQRNSTKWCFEPAPYERLAWLLDFLLHEERRNERKVRVTALLAGEVICTELSAFKLVRHDGDEGMVQLNLTHEMASTLQDALDAFADNASSEMKCSNDPEIEASCQRTISACAVLHEYIGKEKANG